MLCPKLGMPSNDKLKWGKWWQSMTNHGIWGSLFANFGQTGHLFGVASNINQRRTTAGKWNTHPKTWIHPAERWFAMINHDKSLHVITIHGGNLWKSPLPVGLTSSKGQPGFTFLIFLKGVKWPDVTRRHWQVPHGSPGLSLFANFFLNLFLFKHPLLLG